MTKKNKAIINFLIFILLCFSTIVINMFMHFSRNDILYKDKKINTKEGNAYSYPYFKDDKDIEIKKFIDNTDKNKIDNITYMVTYLDDYINVLFKMYKEDVIVNYQSILFNKDVVVDINDLVTDSDLLESKIKDYININEIKINGYELSKAKRSYFFKQHELDIYLTDYNHENISLVTINYKELKDHLNFSFIEDETYEEMIKTDQKELNKVIAPVDKNKKLLAFTFDDGPSIYTIPIANELRKYNANATFFLVGYNIKSKNDVVLELFNRGHELGNHTLDHTRLTKFNCEKLDIYLNENEVLVENIINEKIKLLRPPYGLVNDKIINCINYPLILWNIDSRDWESRNVNSIMEVVLKNPQDGDIVLFHDLYETTYESIKKLLPILYNNGFQVVSVSELMEAKGIELQNGERYRSGIIKED